MGYFSGRYMTGIFYNSRDPMPTLEGVKLTSPQWPCTPGRSYRIICQPWSVIRSKKDKGVFRPPKVIQLVKDFSNMPAEGILTGMVMEKNLDEPMEYANVVLYSMRDSSIVAGTVTDMDGQDAHG